MGLGLGIGTKTLQKEYTVGLEKWRWVNYGKQLDLWRNLGSGSGQNMKTHSHIGHMVGLGLEQWAKLTFQELYGVGREPRIIFGH